jgi:hypothetical protein
VTVGHGTGLDAAPRARSGAVAGAASTLVFTWVHDLVISDIWAMLAPMLVAGVACGASLAWSYRRVAARPSVAGWLGYTATHVVMLGLLGAVSVAVFEPVSTMAELVTADAPPDALIGRAMPLTVAYTLASAAVSTAGFARTLRGFGPVLAATTLLVALLGLNVSVIGLVEIPAGSRVVVAELLGLVALLGAVFAGGAVVLERWLGDSAIGRPSIRPEAAPR